MGARKRFGNPKPIRLAPEGLDSTEGLKYDKGEPGPSSTGTTTTMRLPRIATLLLLAAAFPSLRADDAAPAAAPAVSPYAFLAPFVGGVWLGPLPAGKDGVARSIELHFAWTENRHGIRFASAIDNGTKRAPYVSGMYAWNAAKGKLEMFYTDASGSLVEGVVTQDGDVLVHDLTETNSDGTVDKVRVRLTKNDDDTFTNEIFILADGTYGKIAEVKYERAPDASHQP
jgi:hypothetical protein